MFLVVQIGDEVILTATRTFYLREYIGKTGTVTNIDNSDDTIAVNFHDKSGSWWFRKEDVIPDAEAMIEPGNLSGLFDGGCNV